MGCCCGSQWKPKDYLVDGFVHCIDLFINSCCCILLYKVQPSETKIQACFPSPFFYLSKTYMLTYTKLPHERLKAHLHLRVTFPRPFSHPDEHPLEIVFSSNVFPVDPVSQSASWWRNDYNMWGVSKKIALHCTIFNENRIWSSLWQKINPLPCIHSVWHSFTGTYCWLSSQKAKPTLYENRSDKSDRWFISSTFNFHHHMASIVYFLNGYLKEIQTLWEVLSLKWQVIFTKQLGSCIPFFFLSSYAAFLWTRR